ncbi:MAG: PQQ-dependent sugar dehydrogenase [Chitinophagaceae bacterium]
MKPLYIFSRCAACLLVLLFSFQQINSQPVLQLTSLVSGFTNPVDAVPEPGSNRMFIVEQTGAIRIANGATVLGTPFLNINSLLNLSIDERGLLSMAFHPNYLLNRYFFVYYTNLAGDITVARYQRDVTNPDIADPTSGLVLLTIPKPFDNHNGGKLNFGPDGMLYFGTGDGGSGNDPNENGQNGNSLLGKMIRLNVDNFTTPPYYTIPADNPFVGDPSIRDEIWALGLRNPWRWSFDKATGDMWIADVGQGAWEEVDVRSADSVNGANYGWRCREGNHATPGVPACTPSGGTYVPPIFEYGHDMTTGGFAITGGYVYHGSAWPALDNYYVCADYVSGNVWLVRPDGSSVRQAGLTGNISGFAQDNNGELYALSRTAGALFTISVNAVLPVNLISFYGNHFTGRNELRWRTGSEENTQKFIVEYSTNGTDYLTAGEVLATSNSNGSSYTFSHYTNTLGTIKYRLRVVDIDQASKYSPIILLGDKNYDIKVYPTIITGNALQVNSGPSIQRVDMYSLDGKLIFTKILNGVSGYFSVPLPAVQSGMYLVQLTADDVKQTEKILIR